MRQLSIWFAPVAIAAHSLICLPALAASPTVDSATRDQRSAAQKTFEAGSDLYEAGRFEEALVAFRASLELVKSPNSRLMEARCLRELGRYAEAHHAFDRAHLEASESGGRYAEAAAAATAERDALMPKLGFIQVPSATGATRFTVAGQELDAAWLDKPIPADPGEVTVVLQLSEGPKRLVIQVSVGETSTVGGVVHPAPVLAEPAAEQSPTPSAPPLESAEGWRANANSYAWIGGGVAVLGTVGFGVFGSMSQRRYDDLRRSCPAGRCEPEEQPTIDEGRRYQLYANISLGVAVVGAAAGATFLLLAPSEEPVLALGVSPNALYLTGAF